MRFLLLALLLTTGQAFAQTAERDLVDLMYIPNAGVVYGETKLDWLGSQYNVDKTTEVDNHTTFASQTVGFGFTDMLSASLTYRHQLQGEESTKFTGASGGARTYVDTEGPANPTIAGIFRLMDQGSSAYNFDLRAAYTPDLIKNESSNSADDEFSAGSGGANYLFGARFGQKMATSHWSVNLDLDIHGEAEREFDAGNEEDRDAFYVVDLSYRMQENMLPWLDFRGQVGITRTSTQERDNGGVDTEIDPIWVGSAKGTFLFSPIKNTLVIYAGVGGFYSQGYDIEVAGSTSEAKDFKGWTGDLGALYQF